jgi:pyruvate dehydrogenase E2 component (dihydrolipoamide acetyltransferase)
MARSVFMPKQGETVESCLIVEWKKKEGDRVEKDEIICQVETNKAIFEIIAPEKGTLLKILFKEGEDVPVYTPIAIIGEPGESIDDLIPASQLSSSVPISPRARHLAERKGVEISKILGTGPEGRIIAQDVLNFLSKPGAITPEEVAQGLDKSPLPVRVSLSACVPAQAGTQTGPVSFYLGSQKEISVQGIRKIIADKMFKSLQNSAQITLNASAEVSTLLSLKEGWKEATSESDLSRISINDLVSYALIKTLPQFRTLNAHFLIDKIVEYDNIHLGIAVDTPRGLMVPVIHQAQLKSLVEISKETRRLKQACLDGSIQLEEMEGGTFTLTNLGKFGIESFTPILNIPEVAILGVNNIRLQPIRENSEIKYLPYLGLSLTIDHRVVDGATGAKFLNRLAFILTHYDSLHI